MRPDSIIKVSFGGLRTIVSAHRYQYNYGQVLLFNDLDLPESYEVHFSNEEYGTATVSLGDDSGVLIPDIYFTTGEPVYAWLFLHNEADDGRTLYTVKVPVKKRAKPENVEPTPVEQSIIEQAITALNNAVDKTTASEYAAKESELLAKESEDSARSSAESAESSSELAGQYASDASASSDEASLYAESAEQSMASARVYSEQANQSADDAQTAKTSAETAAGTATQKASEASNSASTASTAAQIATAKADEASASAITASGAASTATQKATEAVQKATEATEAKAMAENARDIAEAAQTAAETAQTKAEESRDEAVDAAEQLKKVYLVTGSSSGSIATFDDGSETPVKSLSVNIEPVQAGSGDPSPENVRPISGWDGVNVTVAGENLFDKDAITDNTWIAVNGTELEPTPSYVTSDYIRVSEGDKIWMPIKTSNRTAYYDLKKQGIEYFTYGGGTVLTVAHEGYIRVTIKKDIDLDTFQIIRGTTGEPYEPYTGTVYPISLLQTVYGGVLDVKNGTLTVTKAYGSAESCSELGGFFYIRLPNSLVRSKDSIMDKLAYQNAPRTDLRDNRFSIVGGDATVIWIKIGGLSTLAEYNAYLAENPIHYVSPLATPLTINLTPIEVRTILGYNNIYADSGNVDVVYYRSLDIVINKLLQQA